MSKTAFERKLAALETLRVSGASESTVAELQKALRERNNYLVAKAAGTAAELGLNALIPELVSAFDRFLAGPAKSDPQCWAKNALSKALADLGHDEAAVFVRGLAHVQMEPVWGGSEDTAGTLRGNCALALVQCRDLGDLEILAHLVEALADRDKTVRIEAARSIAHLGREEGALLLRFRALVGDEEPEALGACFSALLAIGGRKAMPFVARFLDRDVRMAGEAAMALALTRDPEAYRVLKARWATARDSSLADILVTAIGLTRLPEAVDFLLSVVANATPSGAAAIAALAWAGHSDEIRARLKATVDATGDPQLHHAYQSHFG